MVELDRGSTPFRIKLSLVLGLWMAMLVAYFLAPVSHVLGFAAAAVLSGLDAAYAGSQVSLIGKRWVWFALLVGLAWLLAIAIAVLVPLAPGGGTRLHF